MKPQEQTYSKSRRLKNQIKAVVTNPYNIIVLIAVVLLVYLIVLPLLDMIATTFELAQRDIRAVGGGKAGDFTLYYWQRLLASELSWTMLIKPLINSLVIGVCVSVCAILLGSILAWLMVRSDLPFKKFFSLAVIIPYMNPLLVQIPGVAVHVQDSEVGRQRPASWPPWGWMCRSGWPMALSPSSSC